MSGKNPTPQGSAWEKQCHGRIGAGYIEVPLMSWRFLLVLLGWSLLARPALGAGGDVEFFEKRIRPVLVAECYRCHSAMSEKLKGGLRLDTHEATLKGGESGRPAVVPGDVEKSSLI